MIRRLTRPLVRTQAELDRLWTDWVRRRPTPPLGTTCLFIAPDGTYVPRAVTFTDLDGPLDADRRRRLALWIGGVLEGHCAGWRIAPLIGRPGVPMVEERDLGWAISLHAAVRLAGVACEVVHLVIGDEIRPLPLDALSASAAGT